MRSFTIVASLLALTVATTSSFAGVKRGGEARGGLAKPVTPSTDTPKGPYRRDAAGKCHAANGRIVSAAFCQSAQVRH